MANVDNAVNSAPRPRTQTKAKRMPDKPSTKPPKIPVHELYALPAPIRTFPLPSFYPSNPLSLIHVLWAWTRQVLSPPPAEPSVIHQGHWSPETRSVHVRDAASIRALWEQGFFGKGHYSRSEPNWLKREQNRQGQGNGAVSEMVTVQRREERQIMKWDRARKEQEAILKTRQQEAWVAPVGPKELLALPNSLQDLQSSPGSPQSNGDAPPEESPGPVSTPRASPNGVPSSLKRRKSVRFSPTVESATFQLGDPPSPHLGSSTNGKIPNGQRNGVIPPLPRPMDTASTQVVSSTPEADGSKADPSVLIDKEHLQLSPEEAFYLVFALGALSVIDPATGKSMTTQNLFRLFCGLSYFPPSTSAIQPDDPFLVQYAAYHHFRSLGWVVRSGIKFGVDWLLYIGGPVFSHAEFTVTVVPAYTDPYWVSQGHRPAAKSWHWLHAINRVQSHALKNVVLVYVDIPPPSQATEPSVLLKGYKVREFVMKRWLSNRSR
ncbi:hypothetical protein F4777DRAFT_72242 [Nemania sp. FL0916]|nr:hypothetical protein F4777DRAFT_72242 [Nemania sp. FL0916]